MKETTVRYIVIKWHKTGDKEKKFKGSQEKQKIHYTQKNRDKSNFSWKIT